MTTDEDRDSQPLVGDGALQTEYAMPCHANIECTTCCVPTYRLDVLARRESSSGRKDNNREYITGTRALKIQRWKTHKRSRQMGRWR